MTVYRVVVPFAILIVATTTGLTMSVMTNATGPYNYSCDEFRTVKPAERKLALAFAQGYFAALNMQREVGSQVNLQERWKELNARIEHLCNDKSNPYLYRQFVGDFVEQVLDEMAKNPPEESCSGNLVQEQGHLLLKAEKEEGICVFQKDDEPRVLATCSKGKHCEVTGSTEFCKDGAVECVEVTHITKVAK